MNKHNAIAACIEMHILMIVFVVVLAVHHNTQNSNFIFFEHKKENKLNSLIDKFNSFGFYQPFQLVQEKDAKCYMLDFSLRGNKVKHPGDILLHMDGTWTLNWQTVQEMAKQKEDHTIAAYAKYLLKQKAHGKVIEAGDHPDDACGERYS